ncbi:MAG: hypothetical protein HQL20_02650 [Candidatus Omnitrophica bacterium]|nr:hypothetical protein [Candidatus Omnitrophota bacterium]
MIDKPKIVRWGAVVLIVIVGVIHVVDAPDCFQEAEYKGWLFYANGAGALAAAYGLWRRQNWGWYLGLLVAAGSFAGYVASRTVGLPLIPAEPGAWLEPLGIASLVVEGGFIALFMSWRFGKSG